MEDLKYFYAFIAGMWFYQEWRDGRPFFSALLIGVFWIFEVYYLIGKRITK